MRRCVFLGSVLLGLLISSVRAEDPVHFADAHLKAAVEAQLGIVDPTSTDMLGLDFLEAPNQGIELLTGLEYATEMRYLILSDNNISDLTVLSSLTGLGVLDLANNAISDASPVSAMVGLHKIDLSGNHVTDLSVFDGMGKLRYLILNNNGITHVPPFAALSELAFLELNYNDISSISSLGNLEELQVLELSNNHLTDLSFLDTVGTSLKVLYLHCNQISDTAPIRRFPDLEFLQIHENFLDQDAYCVHLNAIYANNPDMRLYYDGNPGPVSDVSASDGAYDDKVVVAWDGLCAGPTLTVYYRVFRSTSADGGKVCIGDPQVDTTFEDVDVVAGQTYYYWIQSTQYSNPAVSSRAPYSAVETGYASVPPSVLSISSTTGGTVTSPGEGTSSYEMGSSVAVSAAPEANHYFTGWSGTAVDAGKVTDPTAPDTTVTVDADYTLLANFDWIEYTVTISAGPGGSVLSPGEGCFSCAFGVELLLEAQADPGYIFDHWGGGNMWCDLNPFPLTVDGDLEIMAVFAAVPCTLDVSSGDGGSVAVPGEGGFSYLPGTKVTAVAVPDSGYRFAGWSGTCAAVGGVGLLDEGRISVVVDADATLHARFEPVSLCLYADSQAADDPNADGSWEHPFGTIQEAIKASRDGQAVMVLPGTYCGNVSFLGKAITVSAFDLHNSGAISQTIIRGNGQGSVVTFDHGECANSILAGFVIVGGNTGGGGGIYCAESSPIIANCVITGNRANLGGGVMFNGSNAALVNCTIGDNFAWLEGGGVYVIGSSVIINSIIWGNEPQQIATGFWADLAAAFSDIEGGWPGTGNISESPCFAALGYWAGGGDPNWPTEPNDVEAIWVGGDYHLQSTQGRWEPLSSTWVLDMLNSPCIDAGNPDADVHAELPPHGDRVNMGAFGGTVEASLSPAAAASDE